MLEDEPLYGLHYLKSKTTVVPRLVGLADAHSVWNRDHKGCFVNERNSHLSEV